MRFTIDALEEQIAAVKSLADKAGLIYIDAHYKARYNELWLYRAYDTVWLVANVEDSTSILNIGSARGNRDVGQFLDGMIDALDSMVRGQVNA